MAVRTVTFDPGRVATSSKTVNVARAFTPAPVPSSPGAQVIATQPKGIMETLLGRSLNTLPTIKPVVHPLVPSKPSSGIDRALEVMLKRREVKNPAAEVIAAKGLSTKGLTLAEYNALVNTGHLPQRAKAIDFAQSRRPKPGTPGGYAGALRDLPDPGSNTYNASTRAPASVTSSTGAPIKFASDIAAPEALATASGSASPVVPVVLGAGLGLLILLA